MKRLTTIPQAAMIKCCGCIEESNCYSDISCDEIFEGIKKLKEYEDTGLSPEDIEVTKQAVKLFFEDFPKNVAKATDMLPVTLFSSDLKN